MTRRTTAQADDREPQVRRSVDLDTGADEVWRLLTDDRERDAWFGGETRIDVRPGGHGLVVEPDGTRRRVRVDVVEPGRRLAWRWWPADGGPESDVEFVVEPAGPSTRLIVTERRAADAGIQASIAGGVATEGVVAGRLLDLELLVLRRVLV